MHVRIHEDGGTTLFRNASVTRIQDRRDEVTSLPTPFARAERASIDFVCGKTCCHRQIFRRKGERRQNIRFPLKVRKIPAAEHDERVRRAAEMVDLTALLDRRPAELSGGQRQRVALAAPSFASRRSS